MKNEKSFANKTISDEEYLACERQWVFLILMLVAGFYGAYTFSIRGGVFCNAQTANFVMMAMSLGKGEWLHALYYFIPMSAYLLGTMVSEGISGKIKRTGFIRWDTLLILIEIIAVVILGFIPESAPYQISQVTINFICSMQYNTFRQANGIPMATTFCTNHLRQVGVAIVKLIKKDGDMGFQKTKLINHSLMIGVFVLGGIFSSFLCMFFLGKAIWGALIPLGFVFFKLLYADLKKEHDYIDRTPHGH